MATAVITGASSGIGMELAKCLCRQEKADVFYIVARRTERLLSLKEELLSEGAKQVEIVPADLLTAEGLSAVSNAVKTAAGSIRWFVSAAGFGVFGDYRQVEERTVTNMIDLNVKATVVLTQRFLPLMEKGGHVILLGSASCFTALPGFNIYASTKAFVLHYAKALRFEARAAGVYVTCLCPGWVETEFLGKAENTEDGVRTPKKYTPLLSAPAVAEKCVRNASKGKFYCVTNGFTKFQHLLSKLLPSAILSRLWLRMLKKPTGKQAD